MTRPELATMDSNEPPQVPMDKVDLNECIMCGAPNKPIGLMFLCVFCKNAEMRLEDRIMTAWRIKTEPRMYKTSRVYPARRPIGFED